MRLWGWEDLWRNVPNVETAWLYQAERPCYSNSRRELTGSRLTSSAGSSLLISGLYLTFRVLISAWMAGPSSLLSCRLSGRAKPRRAWELWRTDSTLGPLPEELPQAVLGLGCHQCGISSPQCALTYRMWLRHARLGGRSYARAARRLQGNVELS